MSARTISEVNCTDAAAADRTGGRAGPPSCLGLLRNPRSQRLAFVAFNLTGQAASDPSALNQKAEEVFTFLAEHPYLEPPPELSQTIDSAVIAQIRSRDIPKPSSSRVEREQEHLDQISVELRDIVRSSPVMRWAYYPAEPSPVQAISSTFIHGDLFHLLGNMLFLFVTAPFIEDVFGRPLFVALYLTGGLVATFAHVARSESDLPLIGASGAVAAIMGAYLVRFFRTRLEFIFIPFILRPMWSYRFFMPAFLFLPFWFGRELFSAMNSGESGIAFWAHVGGFAYGAVFAFGIRLSGVEEKYIHPKIEGQISWRASSEVESATNAWRLGDVATARQQLAKVLMENPNDIDARQLLVELSFEEEDWTIGGAQAAKLLDQYVSMNEMELGRNLAWDLVPHLSKLPTSLLSRSATLLDRMKDDQTALQFWEEIARREGDSQGGLRALIQMLRIQISLQRDIAAGDTLARARAHPLCDGGWSEAVEAQAARVATSGPAGGTGRIPVAE